MGGQLDAGSKFGPGREQSVHGESPGRESGAPGGERRSRLGGTLATTQFRAIIRQVSDR